MAMATDTTAERTSNSRIATLFPGYFALVMATGIVSIGAELRGFHAVAVTLLWINVAAYVVLWALTVVRVVRYPSAVAADLTSHQKGAAFLTVVAATNVLGSELLIVGAPEPSATIVRAAEALWFLGVVLWIVLLYTFFIAVTVKASKPSLEAGLNGGWLLLVVSTESVAVLGARVAGSLDARWVLFLSLGAFLIGAMLYLLVIGLVFYRWTFFSMSPEQLSPPYWINMGALAIATLAGSNLLLASTTAEDLQPLQPFIGGLVYAFWAFATWWIPVLLAAGIWRHGVRRHPLSYDAQFWALVFPLGMYTTCSIVMVTAMLTVFGTDLAFLGWIPATMFWIALAAWLVTFVAMLASILRRPSPAPAVT